ncbi:MAG: glutaminase family protein [Acidimicrobiales bacterium]
MSRRRFIQASGVTVVAAAGAVSGRIPEIASAKVPSERAVVRCPPLVAGELGLTATPIRPPAVPLIVRQPYLSTWLGATALPGTWETFWSGQVTAIGGLVRIDGESYMFAGAPAIVLDIPNGGHPPQSTVTGFQKALTQTSLEVTPTRSIFILKGGGIEMTVEYLSPVEPGKLKLQSVPMAWFLLGIRSLDSQSHSVSVYVDISGEWLSGNRSQQFTWRHATRAFSGGMLQVWSLELTTQQPLVEINQQAEWGTVVWATRDRPDLTYESGPADAVRAQFVRNGTLRDRSDPNYTVINDHFPVFAYAVDLGKVDQTTRSLGYSIGQVRTPALSYLGQDLQPLWRRYWTDWPEMLSDFHADLTDTSRRASVLDARIGRAARAIGGIEYEGLCTIALRQAYGGTELVVGPDGTPWAFLKEISSDGDTSTVDVIFPASPVWMYLDPTYLSLLLKPLLAYAKSGNWTAPWAPHDLGPYPTATGYPNNGGENMPMEESANMIIMATAYAQAAPGAISEAYLKDHYETFRKWATYLTEHLPDPGFQNQTDDFAGLIAHSVNLAVKGIIAVAAMGQIAAIVRRHSDAAHFRDRASHFIATWISRSQDPSDTHIDLTYNGDGHGDGTWGTTYNAFADSLLGTGLIPKHVRAEQADYYLRMSNIFGLPLQVPHSYAKSDWELWTAAWLKNFPIKTDLIRRVYLYANTTASRVPFSDLYDTISGNQVAFQARPVQGGVFSLLALEALAAKRKPGH